MLEDNESLIDNYLNSLVTISSRNYDKLKKRNKKILNPEFEIFKYSTFNKHDNSSINMNEKKEKLKYISSLRKKESTKKKKKISFKYDRKSDKNVNKNIKFIRKLTNRNKPEDVYHSCYDTNRTKKNDKFYNEQSLELIQKKLQKKIKDMKNDNKFLESFAAIDVDIADKIMEENINQNKGKKLDSRNKMSVSAKFLIGNYNKNKNNKNSNNISSNEQNKVLEKLNIQTSQQNLSEDSSFLDDSKTIKNKNNEGNNNNNMEYINTKNIILKEKKYRILELKKLIYDSFDDDEIIEDELLNVNIIYISPDDKYIILFDYIIVLLTLYSLIFIPINMSFSICIKHNIINYLMDIIYIIDLILSFFRPYYNFEDELVFNNKKMILHYLYSYFIFDFICSIPFYSFFKLFEKNHNKCMINKLSIKLDNLYRITELFKIFKLLKIMSKKRNSAIKNIIKYIDDYSIFENYKFIFKIFVSLAILHITTCLHIFISRNSFPNWIFNNNYIESSYITIYFISLYYTITTVTTVGYGDITGNTLNELIFQIFLLIAGIMSYSWLISYCSNIIQEKNMSTEKFNDKIRILDNIKLQYADMSKEMYRKIYRYIEFSHLNNNYNPKLLMDSLPFSLKNTLLNEMYKPIIRNLNFFKNFKNSSFVLEIVRKLLPIRAYKNDILLDQGDIIENMILVKEGRLSLEVKINIDNPVESVNKLLNDNTFLGINAIDKKNFDSIYSNFTSLDYHKNNSSGKDLLSSSLLKEVKDKINFLHLKILEIRKSEHFGGLLLFLNRRTFLTLRVKTKKADLYYLKKIDAVEISSNYSNIWKRVNKISFHNLKQILKYMKKIIKQYCSTYGIKYHIKNKNFSNKTTKVKFNLNKNIDYRQNNINNKENNSIDNKHNISNNKEPKSILKKINKNKTVEKKLTKQDNGIKFNLQKTISNQNNSSNNNNSNNSNFHINDNSFYSQYPLQKKKSKFYSILRSNSMPSIEQSDIKINKNELYLTPFSPEDINDEIYIGENFSIKSNNLDIVINPNYSKVLSRSFSNNKVLSISRNSFSIINTKKNIYSFNINHIQLSKNIRIELLSTYDNINKMSKYKYAYDKKFQSKMKKVIKNNYIYKVDRNKRNASVLNRKISNFSYKNLPTSSSIFPEISKKSNNKKIKHNHKDKKTNSSKLSPLKNDKGSSSPEKREDERDNKRGMFKIHPSNTEVGKFNNLKKTVRIKLKKNSLLDEISNNINALNHPNEFYNGLLNNIIKDRDKENNNNENNNKKKKERFSHFTQISKLNLRRSSKTIKEQ